ncbi:MAG TPA: SDR family oxidoreductase [Steroidobacteraceae bacterium]
MSERRIFVTGGAGYLGSALLKALAPQLGTHELACLVASDVREVAAASRLPGVEYVLHDVRAPGLAQLLSDRRIDTVVHLAAIVTPGARSNRELEYAVDVRGTRNVLEACTAASVQRIVVTSSGAAYGYYADNPEWLTEDHAIRGNEAFAYAHHKRLVEEMLASYRQAHPELRQVVLRVGTILGETTRNQITALFDKPRLLAIRGSRSPFVFVWDQDVVGAIEHAIRTDAAGIFNVAGDGALGIEEIAARLGKRCVHLPAGLLRAVLAVLHPLRLSRYGPEQVDFLRYRPVLDNRRLKEVMGYRPRMTSAEVFDFYCRTRGLGRERA